MNNEPPKIIARSNGHEWIFPNVFLPGHATQACLNCGVIRREKDDNRPCKGKVKVGPR